METRAALRSDRPPFRQHAVIDLGRSHFNFWHRKIVRDENRRGEALLLVRDRTGRLLLHTKDHYPIGGWRLLTGGIKPSEAAEPAARREILEETSISVADVHYRGIITYRLYHQGLALPFASYVFEADIGDAYPIPPDDREGISGFRWTTVERLPEIADRLRRVEVGWRDWGRFRAVAHEEIFAHFMRSAEPRAAPDSGG